MIRIWVSCSAALHAQREGLCSEGPRGWVLINTEEPGHSSTFPNNVLFSRDKHYQGPILNCREESLCLMAEAKSPSKPGKMKHIVKMNMNRKQVSNPPCWYLSCSSQRVDIFLWGFA